MFSAAILVAAIAITWFGVGDIITGPDPVWLSSMFTVAGVIMVLLVIRMIRTCGWE